MQKPEEYNNFKQMSLQPTTTKFPFFSQVPVPSSILKILQNLLKNIDFSKTLSYGNKCLFLFLLTFASYADKAFSSEDQNNNQSLPQLRNLEDSSDDSSEESLAVTITESIVGIISLCVCCCFCVKIARACRQPSDAQDPSERVHINVNNKV